MVEKNYTFFKEFFGDFPNEDAFKRKMRLHQGWWRTCILNEEAGEFPEDKSKKLCSSIKEQTANKKNFLSGNTYNKVLETLEERKNKGRGMIQENRLFSNLLSSQPLCFNFFSELSADRNFGLKVLQTFYPTITKLEKVIFEFAPEEKYTGDNSAFDVAFEVLENEKKGLIGLECKYTDTFSSTEYGKLIDDPRFNKYNNIYSKSDAFKGSYAELTKSRVNQLFRNQLIAESLKQNNKYSFVYTSLFCMQDDKKAIEIGEDFQRLLNPQNSNFQIITYKDFITNVQKLDIVWEKREWTMLLWARYCATVLSEKTIQNLK